MRYDIIGNKDYDQVDDLLDELLITRGVKDPKALINVDEKSVYDPFLMRDMQKGVDIILKGVENNKTFCIIPDDDCDGMTSGAYLWLYMKDTFGIECKYVIHDFKKHGIDMEELEKIDFDFDILLVPDGGTSDHKQHKALVEMGKQIVIPDHHESEARTESDDVATINPSAIDGTYPHKTLSGVGVCYKLCKAIDSIHGSDNADNYLDLVALGMVADAMDVRNLETRHLINRGVDMLSIDMFNLQMDNPTTGNGFLCALMDSKKEFAMKKVNMKALGWQLGPVINGTTRMGTGEEKRNMFKALIGHEESVTFQPRRKKKEDPKPDEIQITWQQHMVKKCTSIKGKQDRLVKKIQPLLETRIEDKGLADGKVIFVDGTDEIEISGLTGLIANKISGKYSKPTVILRQLDGDKYGGSMRNFDMSPVDDFKALINSTGLMESKGHAGAAGVFADIENVIPAKDKLDDILKDIRMETTHLVDFEFPVGRIKPQDVVKVGDLKDHWSNTIPEPKFAVINIIIDAGDIELGGSKKNRLKFKKNDLTFVRKNSKQEDLDKMLLRDRGGFGKAPKTLEITVVGTFETFFFEGNQYSEIVIVDYESKEATGRRF